MGWVSNGNSGEACCDTKGHTGTLGQSQCKWPRPELADKSHCQGGNWLCNNFVLGKSSQISGAYVKDEGIGSGSILGCKDLADGVRV